MGLPQTLPTIDDSIIILRQSLEVSTAVDRKAVKLIAKAKDFLPHAVTTVEFVGATTLRSIAEERPRQSFALNVSENLSVDDREGFVCLVSLKSYCEFISNKDGRVNRSLFEANVRDYQGRTEVNEAIQQTLQEGGDEDFWWLNNGVTIIARQASLRSKTLDVEDPQVVNGLQTSSELFKYSEKGIPKEDTRMVLVRVIVTSDERSRDKIIRATNSQTQVQQASLRATDKVQRDIEAHFKPHKLYYDRRKNFYKNEGKPRRQIVSIGQLSQAVMSIVLGEPNTARARPSSLLKRDDDYLRVFSTDYPVDMYLFCAQFVRRVEDRMKETMSHTSARHRNNILFHAAYLAVARKLQQKTPRPSSVSKLSLMDITESRIDNAAKAVEEKYVLLGGDDSVAKGPLLVDEVRKLI